METFILSHFGYCPLVWMFHNRKLNRRINKLHERALRIVYNDYESPFRKLLDASNSFTIHERNIQTLAIELYKVVKNLAPQIMHLIFQIELNPRYPRQNIFKTSSVKTTNWGTETLAHLGPKIWSIIPTDLKKLSLSEFSKKIRKWKPINCPCNLCKHFEPNIGYLTVSRKSHDS